FVHQRVGVKLVDRALDRARRVDHRNPALFNPVERVDAEDDLFERSIRDDARENSVGLEQCGVVARQQSATADTRDESFVRLHQRGMATLDERATQDVCVPPGAGAENDNVHASYVSYNDFLSTAASIRPPWNVCPLLALVNHTSAGLNNNGSIL